MLYTTILLRMIRRSKGRRGALSLSLMDIIRRCVKHKSKRTPPPTFKLQTIRRDDPDFQLYLDTAKELRKKPKKHRELSYDELVALADQTKKNMDEALQELKDELRRMAGRVVPTDYDPPTTTTNYVEMYSLIPSNNDEEDSSSSSCSLSE